ncbi:MULTISPECIES: YbaK/EbsC family protein [unclassified Haladaptatus]|uniref:YbaK/EbsC family protein n=1 Tax=unclassified Haladaptatus TaxID=2622732 RepID=UPI0023E88335|nr:MULTISPECIES: YbaK/EbsC family protein [unclassified Haladaptatus]
MHERASQFAARAAEEYGFAVDIHEFPEGTKTAADAAEAVGCTVAQIASSIAIVADGDLVVVVTSGANHVDFEKVADLQEVPEGTVRMATPEEIKETLGWSIGGVPPFCHSTRVPVYLDETLLNHEQVWAAAGTPQTVFPIDPDALSSYSKARVVDVST